MTKPEPSDPRYANLHPQARLSLAARLGHAHELKRALKDGADIHGSHGRHATALMIAAERDHLDCVLALLAKGASPDQSVNTGSTALMFAAYAGSLRCARALMPLSNPAARSAQGHNAIDNAAMGNQVEMIKALRGFHPALSPESSPQLNPFIIAASCGSFEAMTHLLPSATQDQIHEALLAAADQNKRGCARYLAALSSTSAVEEALLVCHKKAWTPLGEALLDDFPELIDRYAPFKKFSGPAYEPFNEMLAQRRLIRAESLALSDATAPGPAPAPSPLRASSPRI